MKESIADLLIAFIAMLIEKIISLVEILRYPRRIPGEIYQRLLHLRISIPKYTYAEISDIQSLNQVPNRIPILPIGEIAMLRAERLQIDGQEIAALFKDTPFLRDVNLDGSTRMHTFSAEGLEFFYLERIILSGTAISSIALESIMKSATKLLDLRIVQCTNLQDFNADDLPLLPLKKLDICGANITDAGMTSLLNKTLQLEALNLKLNDLHKFSFETWPVLRNLRKIKITSFLENHLRITPTFSTMLEKFPFIEEIELDIHDLPVNLRDLAGFNLGDLPKMDSLKSLTITQEKSGLALALIPKAINLETLRLFGTLRDPSINEDDLPVLKNLKNVAFHPIGIRGGTSLAAIIKKSKGLHNRKMLFSDCFKSLQAQQAEEPQTRNIDKIIEAFAYMTIKLHKEDNTLPVPDAIDMIISIKNPTILAAAIRALHPEVRREVLENMETIEHLMQMYATERLGEFYAGNKKQIKLPAELSRQLLFFFKPDKSLIPDLWATEEKAIRQDFAKIFDSVIKPKARLRG